ncbi:anti-sigma factor family protein [Rhodanobacter ginsengisoli]|uniref:Anti-sigma factor family protein n=1 Tax=Rhodanobacter ginsengisoli TaxID=418646 RepID=A0ABW0QH18_9GAMM
MNPIDDDTLQAYVDGELDAAGAARIDAALAHDDVLARRVQQARALRAQLKAAFDPVLDEPVPAHLSALLRPTSAQATPAPAAHPTHSARRGFGAGRHRARRRWWVPGAAVAASIAVLAVALWWKQGNELVRVHDGQQFAAGALSRALDQDLASAPDPHASIAIGLSFRSADGNICRTFVQRTRPAMAGLACHEAAGWSLPVISAAEKPAGGELRQAASALPLAVQAAVDARIRGEAFDAQQERAARDAGWR